MNEGKKKLKGLSFKEKRLIPNKKKDENSEKLTWAGWIVKKRNIITKIFIVMFILCAICNAFVKVNYDLTEYLPPTVTSKKAIDVMEKEFGYPGTARIMIENVTIYEAELYKQMIEKAHGAGIKIYGATMVPIGKNWYYSELHEQIRVTVNEYIRSENSGFDGYIDMDKAIDDPDNPGTMKAEYAVGLYDYLHPGDAGYEVMGKTAADKLLEVWNTEK